GLSLQGAEPAARLSLAVRGGERGGERHPSCRSRRARPGGHRGGEARRLLGAAACAMGRRGRHIAHSRSRRHRDAARRRCGRAEYRRKRGHRGGQRRHASLAHRSLKEELMTAPLVECVPNFSEGRDPATIDALRSAVSDVSGVQLLDVQSDPAHNRSVFTFVGNPSAVVEAALAAMRVATRRIDLTKHSGEHPRMGATDVVPFVPVAGITMDECVALARTLGERVGKELAIPVFLYAKAATRPEHERLPDIRKGEFEGLRERTLQRDFGPPRGHPTAGATAIGARPFLVAFNVYLDTQEIAVAKEIAKQIRTSSGGLPAVQASGFIVDGLAQVSMNLLDIDITSPAVVFNAIKARAEKQGVAVQKSEIVGLVPERALIGAAETVLRLSNARDHVLEAKIGATATPGASPSLDGWIDELAGGAPTPGGGSAAALAGTLAAALVAMVARLTIGKKAYAAVDARVREILAEAEILRAEL